MTESNLSTNEALILEVEQLDTKILDAEKTIRESAIKLRNLQSQLDSSRRENKELQSKFNCFKADAITTLKAIDLCILASLCTDNQWLTHKARNFRMKHIHQIILNEVASIGDRKLITYDDDF